MFKGVVVYSSQNGSTEKIAKEIKAGLNRSGVETDLVNIDRGGPSSMRGKMSYWFLLVFFICCNSAFADQMGGRFAFVTSEGDNNLSIVDMNTEKVVKALPPGKTPHALVFTANGKGFVNNTE